MARELREIVRRFNDRPVTAGIDQSDQAIKNNLAAELDVPGWNYKPQRYEEYHTCPSMLGFVKSFCGISDFFLKILPFQSKFPLTHALMSCKAIYF